MLNKLYERRKCAACGEWMEEGDVFSFGEYLIRGGKRILLPEHPHHRITQDDRDQLQRILDRAEKEGHGSN